MDFRNNRPRIIIVLYLMILSLVPASPSFSGDSHIESKYSVKKEKAHDVHKRVKESGKELIEAIERGEDITVHFDNLINDIKASEADDRDVRKIFQQIEEELKTLGSARILSRHREALSEYTIKAKEMKAYIDAVKDTKKRKAHPEEVKEKVKGLIEFIEKNKPEKVDLKSLDNRLPWRVVDPGQILLLGDSTGMPQTGPPLVSAEPPTANDLSTTIDVQITPEIQQLANSLGNRPLEIYRHVYNNYDYTPYYGSIKGSVDTYWEKEGNDCDLASLLISLLRASNIPARYVRAKIIIPVDKVRKWTGIDDPMAALQYLSSAKIPTAYYVKSGRISHVEIDHIYAEAYIPYSNYRGTAEDDTGKLWIPLDPSFKDYTVLQEGTDIASQMGFDWKAFSDEYLGELRNITPIEFYKSKFDQYIAQNKPGQTVDTLKRKTEISKMLFDFLPNTLPYMVVTINDRFSAIPQELRHSLRFTIPGTLDSSLSLSEVSGKRITLSFEGATADDQAVIDQYGGIFKTPPYLIEVKPILRISGSKVAEGMAMNAGISASFNIEYTQPGGEKNTFGHHILTGSFNAIGITTGKVRPEFLSIGEVEVSEEPYLSKMLHSLVMKYHNELNNTKQTLNDTMKMKSKTFITEAVVSTKEDIRAAFTIPISFELAGFTIDAKEMAISPMPVDGYDVKKVINFAMVSGHEASYQENRIFEDNMFWLNGWSAVKGLQMLKAMDINVIELEPPLTYFNPNLPDTVVEDINNALNKGWKVIVPEDTGGLPVVPYIKYDPKTGSAGYMIASTAGGLASDIAPDGHEEDLSFLKDLFQQAVDKFIFTVLFPDSPYTVVLGEAYDMGVRVVTEWHMDDPVHGVRTVTEKTDKIDTNWLNYAEWQWPMYSLFPGTYVTKFDGKVLFTMYVWGVRIDTSDSGKYIGISTDNGSTTTSNPVPIKYSIKSIIGVTYSSASMKVKKGDAVVRTINNLEAGEDRITSWDGRDESGNIVPPDDYTVVIEAIGNGKTATSNKHKVTVFKVEITTPTTTEMNISNVPAMPNVPFTARIQPSSIKLSDVTFKWYLETTFRRDISLTQYVNDQHRVPLSGTTEIAGNGNWTPNWRNLIAGGDLHAHVSASVSGIEARNNQGGFQIRGTNPSQAQIFGIATSLETRAVCWQESTHSQFNAIRYTGVGMPLACYAADGGYGLMMRTPASEAHVWNWQTNLQDGVTYLNRVRNDAQTYLNTWYDRDAARGNQWQWNPHTDHPEWVWDDAFARYGPGGSTIYSPNGNSGVRNCSGNASSNPTGCNYANTIRQHINNQPW